MAYTIKSISYYNHYFNISNILNLYLIVKLLVKDDIFNYQPGKESNKSKFTNLYICELKSISIEVLLKLYQYKAYKNQKLGSSLNSKLYIAERKIDNKSNIDVIKGENIFYNSEKNENNNNIE